MSIYPGLDCPNQFPSDSFAVASIYHCWPGRLCCMLFVQVRHPRVCHAALDPFISLPRRVIAWNILLWCHFCFGNWSNWSYVSQLTQHEQHHSSFLDSLECIHYPTGRFRKPPTLHQHKKICTGACMGMFVQPLLCHDVVCVRTFKGFFSNCCCVRASTAKQIFFLSYRNRKVVGGTHNVLVHYMEDCAPNMWCCHL